ncbi:MAG: hypothetical protein JWM27_3401 [Gemmatimonadetes bacterium]|nr:hypothetical protein [Gemmatimonadota bacterium]
MPRNRYGRDYGYDAGYRRAVGVYDRGISPAPYYVRDTLDPNYRGGAYGGMRMSPGMPGQASYGWYRAMHGRDLGDAGGYEGRWGQGWSGRPDFGGQGLYHDEFGRAREQAWARNRDVGMQWGRPAGRFAGGRGQGWPRYDADHHGPWDGGVRGDVRYLHQYNENSPAFRYGAEGDRGYGRAERPRTGGGMEAARPRENTYGGRNAGGFGDMQLPRQARR